MQSIYNKIEQLQSNSIDCVLCTVIRTKGSTPLKSGAKMLIAENNKTFGTIGGGNLEKMVIDNAKAVLKNKIPKIFTHHLLQELNMCCGGTVEIFIEPILKKNNLFVFGSGHVGRALAELAYQFDFDVTLIDNRSDELNKIDNDYIHKIQSEYIDYAKTLKSNSSSFITILTYDHKLDRELLHHFVTEKYAYLGMIGSKRKVEVTKKIFKETYQFTDQQLNTIDMPMGYDIHGQNPNEIALSILTKLIEIKNKHLKSNHTKSDFNNHEINSLCK